MGCVYRPTYRDKHGEKKTSGIWWATFYSNGKQIFESTKTKDHAEAKRYLKRREGEAAKGVPIIKGQQSLRFKFLAEDVITDYRINNKRSKKDVETRFNRHILPAFGERKASSPQFSPIK